MTTLARYCVCSFIIFIHWCSTASAQVVDIPDLNLESAIREELNLSDHIPITQSEMLRLTRLDASQRQISILTGLEHATNLTDLRLARNEISGLAPLAQLNRLERLSLWGNPISDLSPIAGLTQLKRLDLGGCQVSDITPLANLTELTYLTLHSNLRIIDITPLINLTQLTELRLSHNRIVDISPLANLTQLTELQLSHNQIVDISPLANLMQLTDLTLANNTITDFSPLFGLNLINIDINIRKLQELASVDVNIPDPNLERAIREEIGLLADLPITQLVMNQLTGLDAGNNQIEDLTGLEHAANLTWVHLHQNNISSLKPLAELIHLERLSLWGNPISDLSPISGLTSLQRLDLGGCHVSDITPIENLIALTYLTLHSNLRIVDITPLANLTKLIELRLSYNRIVDISVLANLTNLKVLTLSGNRIRDYSPLESLALTRLEHDEVCNTPRLPIEDRIANRSFPSIFQSFDAIRSHPTLSSREDLIALHDLSWRGSHFGLYWIRTDQGYELMSQFAYSQSQRDELLAKNPNMLFLAEIRYRDAWLGYYPEDFSYWIRDDNGDLVTAWYEILDDPDGQLYLLDFTNPDFQDIIVQQAVAVAECGLLDGIMFDWWHEDHFSLADWRDNSIRYSTKEAELEARLSIVRRIREQVPDDFLIIGNTNDRKIPVTAPYMNGGYMETPKKGYTRESLIKIENSLLWLGEHLRKPRVTALEGWGIGHEPPDSPTNKQWMRLFTTMSLTLSDGYVMYNLGGIQFGVGDHEHIWHDFWDANLGQPVGPTAQRHQNIEGLYIREFTNGWAVYNRSGSAQAISLPESAIPVSDRGNNAASPTHILPDLDGEIYLKTAVEPPTLPYDLNKDGVVNVLDLILIAQNFGSTEADINGDGTTNILDLILVAQRLGVTSTPAAPAAVPASLSPEKVQEWIDMAHAHNDGSIAFVQGIATLERLLASMVPDKTMLRANYPNPFNPETWIPYHLANDTAVRISIYDIHGALVRLLNLGHQRAGYYTNRTKAAYWDGRNEIGESVASGVYFYTLTTDDYTGTRRMVIVK